MDTAFNSNPSAGKCHAVIQAVHYAITEKGCPSWSSDPEDAAFTNVGYVPYRNFYHDQCWKSCNATILTEMSKAVVGDPSRESIGCSLVSKAIRHAAVNMRACPVDPRDPKDSSNILLWNDACGYREIYFQSYCPGTCGYQIGRTFLLKVGKGDFPCMYNCDDSGKTVYEKEAAIAMNETLTQLREDERCKDFADARFLAPSVPSANNSQHTNPFISMNITSELVLSKEHDNLYATGYVTEIYPIRVLDPVDAVELPFIGRHRACLVGKRECLTLRAEDMVAKSNKYFQRWGRVCNCWNLGMDLMSEVFIRIWEFRKGWLKGLYLQYTWLFLQRKLWTRDRQEEKLEEFDDGGKGSDCPCCAGNNDELGVQESIEHIKVCEGYLDVIRSGERRRRESVLQCLLLAPRWTMICFATTWKARNGYFYGEERKPSGEAMIRKAKWEWDARTKTPAGRSYQCGVGGAEAR